MVLYALPALYALFIWWFSTGVIMYLDGLPRKTFKWSILGASILMVLSLWGVYASRNNATVTGAYCAFTGGLLAWGWQEISFYMGFVTGTRKDPCPEGCSGWKHFGHAIQTSLWHELAIIASGIVIVAITWGSRNQIGMWTFMVLWWMHQSAKLNVFLGVRNLNEEFLPEHLQFLKSFLTKKPMNLLFPLSITISTVILVKLIDAAVNAHGSRFDAAGFCFLATLMALAILEHWLLMLPLPAAALWGWSLKSRKAVKPFDAEVVSGFLGAGKTTVMRARLQTAGPKTVVLVNDFASVGVDGSLLRERGADVVELPNGCICCSLRKDLAQQLKAVVAQWSPERVLIEPSGVADLASLLGVMRAPDLEPLVRSLSVTTVIDGGAFLRDYGRLPAQLDAQARLSSMLILNKVDLVGPAELLMVETTLRSLNPSAPIMRASFGIAAAGPILPLKVPAPMHTPAHDVHATHEHAHAPVAHHHHDHDDDHHDHAHGDALNFDSWSGLIQAPAEPESLLMLLDRLADGAAGDLERLKGIVRMGEGWVRFDIAGGRPSIAAFAPKGEETARVIAIGRHLNRSFLAAQFGARSTIEDMPLPLPAVA
ncbi:putative photosynthetic complex assembly protein PuhE [Acidisoma cladoniae]|uniref:putative photosynthetic complex assembly protein PuhE n=1 Tax=Acidisoma cladoniae TaxID=3040935 RepID=UPI002550356F|nr:putative photosynthetic complex assembly protein PuhE [Acidisoma sp. PAMC 29798]